MLGAAKAFSTPLLVAVLALALLPLWFSIRLFRDERPLPGWKRRPSQYRVLRMRLALYSSMPFVSGFWFSMTALYLSAYAYKTGHGAARALAVVVAVASCVALAASFAGTNFVLFLYLTKRPIPKILVPTPWKEVDQSTMPERPEDVVGLDPLP